MKHKWYIRSTHAEAGLILKRYNESNNDCIRKHLPKQRNIHRIKELHKEYKKYYTFIYQMRRNQK